MQQAMKSLNYQGTVAFLRNNKLDTMKYSHAVDKEVEQEHLLSLNSPMREVLRHAGNVSCVFKDSKSVEINHRPSGRSFIVDLPENFTEQAAVYDFEIAEQQEVAMLPAQIINIKPKDDYRYARKIWIEQQNFLPLKIEAYDITGAIIEQVMFTELSIEKKLPFAKVDIKSEDLKVKHIHQSSLQAMEKADFVLNNLPQGFKEVFFVEMTMHGSQQSVEHLLLSDGFSSVSIYQEARSEKNPKGIQSAGTVHSLVKIVGSFQFVLMGDVPVKTIQFISDGIKLKAQ
ncbi:MAG: outer membrane lipoprotein-sorting protein [Methylococcaceae bacterium]|nr:outer membrane lipoprotein-sorting protein [Methylococcaceae bacterium]